MHFLHDKWRPKEQRCLQLAENELDTTGGGKYDFSFGTGPKEGLSFVGAVAYLVHLNGIVLLGAKIGNVFGKTKISGSF
jgi:hypothetical protein